MFCHMILTRKRKKLFINLVFKKTVCIFAISDCGFLQDFSPQQKMCIIKKPTIVLEK